MDRLIEAGDADPDRLGLRGHSGGAWLTAWIIGHTHRFQAAVAGGGGGYHQELAYTLPPFSAVIEDERGGKPWEAPDTYRRYSPLTYIPNARTATLLLQGERDNQVQTELLYTWLCQAGVEVEFVKYMGEGHVIVKPEHRADYWRRTLAWFDRHLRSPRHAAPAASSTGQG